MFRFVSFVARRGHFFLLSKPPVTIRHASVIFISVDWHFALFRINTSLLGSPFSETQGQLMGAGKSLKGREKKSGEEKLRKRVRAPGDKVLMDQFQMVGAVLASDCCQKIFVFFCPSTEQ